MRPKPTEPLEDFEIRPLFQIGRAAMNSKDYAPDPLTHEGMILLLNIIEDKIFERGVPSAMSDEELEQRMGNIMMKKTMQAVNKAVK